MDNEFLEIEVENALSVANKISVATNEDEEYAVEFGKTIKRAQKLVSDEFDQGVEDSYALYKSLFAKRAKYLDPLKKAESRIKDLIKDYRFKLERERLEQEKRAKEAAEKSLKEEQDRIMKEAEKAKESGDDKKADDLAFKAATIENGGVFVESKTIKQDGMSVRKTWKARVIDASLIPRQFLIVDQKALDAFAKENGCGNPVPGVEFYEDSIITLRS